MRELRARRRVPEAQPSGESTYTAAVDGVAARLGALLRPVVALGPVWGGDRDSNSGSAAGSRPQTTGDELDGSASNRLRVANGLLRKHQVRNSNHVAVPTATATPIVASDSEDDDDEDGGVASLIAGAFPELKRGTDEPTALTSTTVPLPCPPHVCAERVAFKMHAPGDSGLVLVRSSGSQESPSKAKPGTSQNASLRFVRRVVTAAAAGGPRGGESSASDTGKGATPKQSVGHPRSGTAAMLQPRSSVAVVTRQPTRGHRSPAADAEILQLHKSPATPTPVDAEASAALAEGDASLAPLPHSPMRGSAAEAPSPLRSAVEASFALAVNRVVPGSPAAAFNATAAHVCCTLRPGLVLTAVNGVSTADIPAAAVTAALASPLAYPIELVFTYAPLASLRHEHAALQAKLEAVTTAARSTCRAASRDVAAAAKLVKLLAASLKSVHAAHQRNPPQPPAVAPAATGSSSAADSAASSTVSPTTTAPERSGGIAATSCSAIVDRGTVPLLGVLPPRAAEDGEGPSPAPTSRQEVVSAAPPPAVVRRKQEGGLYASGADVVAGVHAAARSTPEQVATSGGALEAGAAAGSAANDEGPRADSNANRLVQDAVANAIVRLTSGVLQTLCLAGPTADATHSAPSSGVASRPAVGATAVGTASLTAVAHDVVTSTAVELWGRLSAAATGPAGVDVTAPPPLQDGESGHAAAPDDEVDNDDPLFPNALMLQRQQAAAKGAAASAASLAAAAAAAAARGTAAAAARISRAAARGLLEYVAQTAASAEESRRLMLALRGTDDTTGAALVRRRPSGGAANNALRDAHTRPAAAAAAADTAAAITSGVASPPAHASGDATTGLDEEDDPLAALLSVAAGSESASGALAHRNGGGGGGGAGPSHRVGAVHHNRDGANTTSRHRAAFDGHHHGDSGDGGGHGFGADPVLLLAALMQRDAAVALAGSALERAQAAEAAAASTAAEAEAVRLAAAALGNAVAVSIGAALDGGAPAALRSLSDFASRGAAGSATSTSAAQATSVSTSIVLAAPLPHDRPPPAAASIDSVWARFAQLSSHAALLCGALEARAMQVAAHEEHWVANGGGNGAPSEPVSLAEYYAMHQRGETEAAAEGSDHPRRGMDRGRRRGDGPDDDDAEWDDDDEAAAAMGHVADGSDQQRRHGHAHIRGAALLRRAFGKIAHGMRDGGPAARALRRRLQRGAAAAGGRRSDQGSSHDDTEGSDEPDEGGGRWLRDDNGAVLAPPPSMLGVMSSRAPAATADGDAVEDEAQGASTKVPATATPRVASGPSDHGDATGGASLAVSPRDGHDQRQATTDAVASAATPSASPRQPPVEPAPSSSPSTAAPRAAAAEADSSRRRGVGATLFAALRRRRTTSNASRAADAAPARQGEGDGDADGDAPVLMTATLFKRSRGASSSSTGGSWAAFVERRVQLRRGGVMEYFKPAARPTAPPQGSFAVADVSVPRLAAAGGRANVFEVASVGGKAFQFAARSSAERDAWVAAIGRVLGKAPAA